MKVYRRHRCNRKHRSYRTLAKCMFSYTHIFGPMSEEGPYALVSWCKLHHPDYNRRGITITLHPTFEQAEETRIWLDGIACGGGCSRQHEVIKLVME